MKTYTPEEPIAAIATALVPAALAIIRVSGKNSISLLKNIFSRPKALEHAGTHTLVYGWIIMQNVKNHREKIDEVVIGVYRAPKSFTGEEMAEIYCHGGTATVQTIYNLLLQTGFREAERGEFTFRSFINGKTDLTRSEAIHEIINAKTDESRRHATERLAGSLYTELDEIKQDLIETLADIEAETEYPEDENAVADAYDSKKLFRAYEKLTQLATSWKSEKLYQDGAKIVLCGKTNAGKSSLFNMLLKEERAIISQIPGTTRDWIESFASFAGIPVRLFDTAGFRQTDNTIEQTGIMRSQELAEEADLIFYVVDINDDLTQEEYAVLKEFASPVIIVRNKIDTCDQKLDNKKQFPYPQIFASSKNGTGIAELIELSQSILLDGNTTEHMQAGLGSKRQKTSTDDALEAVTHAIEATQQGFALDAIAQDIENALQSLGEITGEVKADDILESIFSRFCVGK